MIVQRLVTRAMNRRTHHPFAQCRPATAQECRKRESPLHPAEVDDQGGGLLLSEWRLCKMARVMERRSKKENESYGQVFISPRDNPWMSVFLL